MATAIVRDSAKQGAAWRLDPCSVPLHTWLPVNTNHNTSNSSSANSYAKFQQHDEAFRLAKVLEQHRLGALPRVDWLDVVTLPRVQQVC
jgi:hypothetical protein